MKPVPAYRQSCFLLTPKTLAGDIDLAPPAPATAASTPDPPTSLLVPTSPASLEILREIRKLGTPSSVALGSSTVG